MRGVIHLALRATPFFKLASEYTSAQIITRLMAATSGLLLVRLLPVNEYGLYTLVLSAFVFVCTFSDLGLTETLSFFRRRSTRLNKPWVEYLNAVVRFRRIIFGFGFLLAAGYIYSTGRYIDINSSTLSLSILTMGFGAWFAIQAGIYTYVLKLEQRFRSAYAVELANESLKLISVGFIWLIGLTTAIAGFAGVALGSFAAALFSLKLHNQAGEARVPITRRRSKKTARVLLAQVSPILPGTIQFALQGPLIAWLAAFYGSIENVAVVGAIGRIGALIGFITGFTTSVFVPRIIAINDETIFFKRYLLWWMVILTFGSVILVLVAIYPASLLFLLGSFYEHLHAELLLTAAMAVAGTWSAFAWSINRARGWIKQQPYRVLVIILGQVFMFHMLDFTMVKDVLIFGLGTIILDVFFQTVINVIGFRAIHRNKCRSVT